MSARYDDAIYMHNDSGDTARFFRINESCRTTGTFVLGGVQARDWEDMSRGPNSTLWLGDIGDNSGTRVKGLLVHRVAEPPPTAKGMVRVSATSYRLRYPDGAHDAEALLVHPRTGQLLIITKGFGGGAVYAAPLPLQASKPNFLTAVGRVSVPQVTGGDISPDGSHVVLRNYTAAYEWAVDDDDVAAALKREPTRIPLPRSPQGEAISYTRDGRALVVTSEGAGAQVQDVKRDQSPAPSPSAAAGARSSTWSRIAVATVLAALVLLVIGVLGLRRTRSRSAR